MLRVQFQAGDAAARAADRTRRRRAVQAPSATGFPDAAGARRRQSGVVIDALVDAGGQCGGAAAGGRRRRRQWQRRQWAPAARNRSVMHGQKEESDFCAGRKRKSLGSIHLVVKEECFWKVNRLSTFRASEFVPEPDLEGKVKVGAIYKMKYATS